MRFFFPSARFENRAFRAQFKQSDPWSAAGQKVRKERFLLMSPTRYHCASPQLVAGSSFDLETFGYQEWTLVRRQRIGSQISILLGLGFCASLLSFVHIGVSSDLITRAIVLRGRAEGTMRQGG
jgi:hypothetical protein